MESPFCSNQNHWDSWMDVHPKYDERALEFCSHQVINKELVISHQQKMEIKPSLRLDA